jgi:Sec-independent protein secretion pathway component TatC
VGALALHHPGLNPTEKRYAVPFLFASRFLFTRGAAVALLTLEPALHFRRTVGGSDLKPRLTAGKYVSLVSPMIAPAGSPSSSPWCSCPHSSPASHVRVL